MPAAAARRPEVFISATSGDLRTCRQLVKEALLTLGCTPVEQTNFPPSATTVREMLRQKLLACDAVVHLAGLHYGAEPTERSPDQPRRSYTQLEYDLARELGRPVYVFVCGDQFPYDPAPTEDDEKRALQLAHRARLQSGDHLFTPIADRTELTLRVHALQTKVEHLAADLKKSRSWLARGVAATLVLATLLGAGLWLVNQRADRAAATAAATRAQADATATRVAILETALDQQRRYLKSVADAFTQQKSELDRLNLPDDEKLRRAISVVATREGLSPAELQSSIDLFVAATKADPKADFMDKALADFAEKNFASAAANAGKAADQARTRRLAAEQLAAQASSQLQKALDAEREALDLRAQSLDAEHRYAEAVPTYEAALAITPREKNGYRWSELQSDLASSLDDWADRSEGLDISERRTRSLSAYDRALADLDCGLYSDTWARIRSLHGLALDSAAVDHGDAASSRALSEAAEQAQLDALEIRTRASDPDLWAISQRRLGTTLLNRAERADYTVAAGLLDRAETAFRSALEINTRDRAPDIWAGLQIRLGDVWLARAMSASVEHRMDHFDQCLRYYESALPIRTREQDPEDWAFLQSSIAAFHLRRAESLAATERVAAANAANAALRGALEVFTRDTRPQNWATQNFNLGYVSLLLAESAVAEARDEFLRTADTCFANAGEVFTREALPLNWANLQLNLGALARLRTQTAGDTSLVNTIRSEAVTHFENALTVCSPENNPHSYIAAYINLGVTLVEIISFSTLSDPGTSQPLHSRALDAFSEVLRLSSSDRDALNWARAQIGLAALHLQKAMRQQGDTASVSSLQSAVTHARAVIDSISSPQAPREWALAHINLGQALILLASTGEPGVDFRLAETAIRTVLDAPESSILPADLAFARQLLAGLLYLEADQKEGTEARFAAFEKTRVSVREILALLPAESFPEPFARVTFIHGLSVIEVLESSSPADAPSLAKEGRDSLREAAKFFTRETFPELHQEILDALHALDAQASATP